MGFAYPIQYVLVIRWDWCAFPSSHWLSLLSQNPEGQQSRSLPYDGMIDRESHAAMFQESVVGCSGRKQTVVSS